MPVTDVYQMPWGRRTCLPRGCSPGVGRVPHTDHELLFAAGRERVGDVERERVVAAAVLARRCVPLTYTVASQSTAPKCSSSRPPPGGVARNVRRYQRRSDSATGRRTRLSCDSIGKGTRMRPSHAAGRAAALSVTAYCHQPLRFRQPGRTSCGRGYSGSTLAVSTSAAHRVCRVDVDCADTGRANAVSRAARRIELAAGRSPRADGPCMRFTVRSAAEIAVRDDDEHDHDAGADDVPLVPAAS